MTLTWSHWALPRPASFLPVLANAVANMGRALAAAHARGRQRRALAELDDHLLRDLGLTRVELWRENSKPFWRS